MLEKVAAAGVDEVACLIDFGVPDQIALDGLSHLASLREQWRQASTGAPAQEIDRSIAVIGVGLRLPGCDDLDGLEIVTRSGQCLLSAPPPGRFAAGSSSLQRAGFIEDVDLFDPASFGMAPAEAAAMDPHHRVLLKTVQDALADAAIAPEDLRGAAVGVFTALYSTSYSDRRRGQERAPDALDATGAIHSMAPNRISHLFDWSGPSEIVATSCSSGLVAVHRAMRALRDGECDLALVCGASLLLSDAESAGLRDLGVLSPEDRCRAFHPQADGQARGEGAVAVLLKPHDAAIRDGDPTHALLRGSATNHSGGGSGFPDAAQRQPTGRVCRCSLARCRSAALSDLLYRGAWRWQPCR